VDGSEAVATGSTEPDFVVRPERMDDVEAVDEILRQAFDGPGEAELVKRMRREAPTSISLVAERAGHVLGHVLFSAVRIEGDTGVWPALGLGPVAVAPDAQRTGIGSALVRAGLAACAARPERLVFVLGHPDYYPRFGFRLTEPLGLRYGEGGFERAFFVLELEPGAAAGRKGRVEYHPAFDGL
jgi:putative acetyltransferase